MNDNVDKHNDERSTGEVTPAFAFHRIWVEQCAAARDIRTRYGTQQALGYLVGEKLLNFVREADRSPAFAAELPCFVEEIKCMFVPAIIADYLDQVRRVGALGHVCDDETYDEIKAAGMIEDDSVAGAEDVLLMARIREMLLPVASA